MNKNYKDIILRDNESPYGGTSHMNETLAEFLEECGLEDASEKEIDEALIECGIEPVFKPFCMRSCLTN